MMNNLEIVLAIWKRQYETDFALLNTHQEEIEFLQDLLIGNKKKITELEEEKLSITENQTKLSNLEDLQELLLSKLKTARRQKLVLPTYETHEVQKIPTELSSELSSKRKPHTAFIANEMKAINNRGDTWEKLIQLANDSVGKNQVELPGYGKIYLRRVRKNPEKEILYSHESFDFDKAENLPDGVDLIKKTAFDTAWTQIAHEENMKKT
jgi:hypothetical protein